jgi:CRP-like cAMP-binding protein
MHVELDDAERRIRHEKKEHDRRLRALDALPFLSPLNEEERASLAASLIYTPFSAGETMTKQGAVAHWLYILREGTADVIASRGEESKRIAKISAPTYFGEMGCMTGKPRAATVVATSDVVCYRLDKQAFVDILNERPEIAKEISAVLAERRVELGAAQGELDEGVRRSRVEAEKRQILPAIEAFFGLRDDSPHSNY